MEFTKEFNEKISLLVNDKTNADAFDAAIEIIGGAHSLLAGRLRKKLSLVTEASISDIKKCEKSFTPAPLTHSQIASHYIGTLGEVAPVGVNGNLWLYCQESRIWNTLELPKLAVKIGKKYCTHSRCVRKSDYDAIANLTYDEMRDEYYFKDAPSGISTPDGFYTVKDNRLVCIKATPKDKARFKVNISPRSDCQTPEFIQMLKDAFGDTYADQIRQLRMFFGLSIIGLQHTVQKACFLHGAGGSGKSTILRILESIIPPEYVAHTNPLKFDCDYKKAALADKLLNLVPEIEKTKIIPSADFKSITGEDSIDARQPFGRVFNFKSKAANWFNGNFYITTRDHKGSFYRRWAMFRFYHAKPEEERDTMLTGRIIMNELPGILAWSFEGVKDYLENGLYLSAVHELEMDEWKTEGNSVFSWLKDDENGIFTRNTGDNFAPLTRTKAYKKYLSWCLGDNSKKPFSKKQFYVFVEEFGYISTKYNGNYCYTGLSCESAQTIQDTVVRMPF